MPTGSQALLQARSAAALNPSLVAEGTWSTVLVPTDFRSEPFTDEAAADGSASVGIPAASIGYHLLIERISIQTDSTAATGCAAYIGSVAPQNRIDYSPDGNSDIADESQPILVPGGQAFILQWTNMSAGSTAFARMQWRVVVPVRQLIGG